ncbi:MAG TPA: ribonuclease HII [Hyphomicrobiales bacterium]|nr:ribonuclease HII [Hyphomicrobiales bacterium]
MPRAAIAGTTAAAQVPAALADFRRERAAYRAGEVLVAGVDEAGRGPLAGPVTVAAVVLSRRRIPKGLADSKLLTVERREALFEEIVATAEVAVVSAPPARIDRDNIRNATLWAMARAVAALPCRPSLVLIDGCDVPPGLACRGEAIVDGDALVASIAAASIVAKVTRDRLMRRLGAACPGYLLEKHMGYATPEHKARLAALGPTRHHRRSFAPVRLEIEQLRLV